VAVLDTTLLLDLIRKPASAEHRRATAKLDAVRQAGQALTTTRVNVAELWVGVERSESRDVELKRVEGVLAGVAVLEADEPAARRFGWVKAHPARKGTVAGDFDMMIAAIALCHGQTVVTRNPKHFVGVPGLVVETY
jgi:tRNA(fMet)-specific endonuclease VapC